MLYTHSHTEHVDYFCQQTCIVILYIVLKWSFKTVGYFLCTCAGCKHDLHPAGVVMICSRFRSRDNCTLKEAVKKASTHAHTYTSLWWCLFRKRVCVCVFVSEGGVGDALLLGALMVSLEFREFLCPLSGQRLSQCCSQSDCWGSREQSFKSPRGDSSVSRVVVIWRRGWGVGGGLLGLAEAAVVAAPYFKIQFYCWLYFIEQSLVCQIWLQTVSCFHLVVKQWATSLTAVSMVSVSWCHWAGHAGHHRSK